jgi:hypothetical protein
MKINHSHIDELLLIVHARGTLIRVGKHRDFTNEYNNKICVCIKLEEHMYYSRPRAVVLCGEELLIIADKHLQSIEEIDE